MSVSADELAAAADTYRAIHTCAQSMSTGSKLRVGRDD